MKIPVNARSMHFLFCFLFFNAFKKSHLQIQMANTSNDFLTEATIHYEELPYLISTPIHQVKLFREWIITERYFSLPPLPTSIFCYSFSSRFFVMHIPLYFYLLAVNLSLPTEDINLSNCTNSLKN